MSDPDVGMPSGAAWRVPAGRLSGWDIKNIYFQLDFECAGICVFSFVSLAHLIVHVRLRAALAPFTLASTALAFAATLMAMATRTAAHLS